MTEDERIYDSQILFAPAPGQQSVRLSDLVNSAINALAVMDETEVSSQACEDGLRGIVCVVPSLSGPIPNLGKWDDLVEPPDRRMSDIEYLEYLKK